MRPRSAALAPALALALALALAVISGRSATAAEGPTGFRLEGESRLAVVFGDAATFRRHIDRFHEVHGRMQATREDFSRNVQMTLASLGAAHAGAGKQVSCPVETVAASYRRAHDHGQRYHELGKTLEAGHAAIRELDLLGETTSLTPDYRWRVARALKLYPQVLRDFREMKLAFQEQLAGELPLYGCDPQRLIARGGELIATREGGAEPTPAIPPLGGVPSAGGALVTAASFFVDNSSCATPARVFLDGATIGEVGPRAKAAFRATVGPHELCLLPSASAQRCGAQGTVRRVHVHDGWAIELRCD